MPVLSEDTSRNDRDVIRNQIVLSLFPHIHWIRSESAQRQGLRIAVYGAGSHTDQLLQVWQTLGLPRWSRVLVSSTPTSAEWMGFPVSQISDVRPEKIDLIVLSSSTYESEMVEACIRRYPSVPRITIWTQSLSGRSGSRGEMSAAPRVEGDALLLKSAMEHYERGVRLPSDGLPDQASRWSRFREDMAGFIENVSSVSGAISVAQSQCGFDHRMSYRGWQHVAHLYFNALSYEHPTFRGVVGKFAESPVSLPQSIGVIDGVPLSNISLCHSVTILTNLWFESKIDSVCEIGGGYGGPARLWLTNPIRPAQKYAIIDLPESLFFAECFLRASLPEKQVIYASTEDDVRLFEQAEQAVLLCPVANSRLVDRVRFDLIVNTGSLGELSDAWVRFWARWLERQQAGLFYSLNYFGNPHTNLFEGRNIISPIVAPDWVPQFVRVNHALVSMQSVERNSAELIFRRMPGRVRDGSVLAQELCDGRRLDLRDLATYVFDLPESVDVEAEARVIDKILVDFDYVPKELIHLLERITSAEQRCPSDATIWTKYADRHATLLREYAEAFPRGTGVE